MKDMPKMYSQIQLTDGRKGIVVDYLGEMLIVDTVDENRDWITVQVMKVDNEYCVCEDNGQIYRLCNRKGVCLQVSDEKIYCFLLSFDYDEEYFCVNEQQHIWLCELLNIDIQNFVESWSRYFEYHNYVTFLNAYKMVVEDKFYYAYGYDVEEKTADALYRYERGRFERYFPREAVWREMPEQRMILEERKHRYTRVSPEEGLSLSLLV